MTAWLTKRPQLDDDGIRKRLKTAGMRTALSSAIAGVIAIAAALPATEPVDLVTDTSPDCEACAQPENAGLCHREHCRNQILPVLKEPAWYDDAHSGPFELEARRKQHEEDAATRKAKRRNERKKVRAHERLIANAMGLFVSQLPAAIR